MRRGLNAITDETSPDAVKASLPLGLQRYACFTAGANGSACLFGTDAV
jgi:hypothetical protein